MPCLLFWTRRESQRGLKPFFSKEKREGWGREGLRVAGGFFRGAPPASCAVRCFARLHSYFMCRAVEMEGEGTSASPLTGSRSPRCHRHRRSGEKTRTRGHMPLRTSKKSQPPGLLGASVPSPGRSLRVRGGLGQLGLNLSNVLLAGQTGLVGVPRFGPGGCTRGEMSMYFCFWPGCLGTRWT